MFSDKENWKRKQKEWKEAKINKLKEMISRVYSNESQYSLIIESVEKTIDFYLFLLFFMHINKNYNQKSNVENTVLETMQKEWKEEFF